MGKKLFIIVLSIFSFFFITNDAFAEEKCSYKDRAELNKIAANVTATYEVKKDENNQTFFRISIYNITEKIYVNITNTLNPDSLVIVNPPMTTNGVYTFDVSDINTIITYTIVVRSSVSGCTEDIRRFNFIKPKKNKFFDYEECKYDDTAEYSYCSEWITSDFTLSDEDILTKIEEQRKRQQVITTTRCIDCIEDVRYNAKKARIMQIKKIIVIGLSIGISIDMIYIYIKISNIRRYEL